MNQTRTWDLRVHITEQETTTMADMLLTTDEGAVLTGHGEARRHPRDHDVPEVGDELATARAMSHLAHKLLDTAAQEMSRAEHRTVRITS